MIAIERKREAGKGEKGRRDRGETVMKRWLKRDRLTTAN